MPQADDPPVLFPDPEVWQLLTELRCKKRNKNVDLARNDPAGSEDHQGALMSRPSWSSSSAR